MWRNLRRNRSWSAGLGVAVVLVAGALAVALHWALRVPTVALPAQVDRQTHGLLLAGKNVSVDFYIPKEAVSAPVVVVAHGFSRNRKTMAGWGVRLAEAGFLAAVPDLPAWADHARNGRALAELLAQVQSGRWTQHPKPENRAALVGFSAGGTATLLAAAGNTNVGCWVGLDPVGMVRQTTEAAKTLHFPCFVLRAEPGPWNLNGNARHILSALPGPAFSLVVNQATHVDAENPTSRAGSWVCGGSDPKRRELFGQYLLAGLRWALLENESALAKLLAATNDPAVREVEFHPAGAYPSGR